MWNADMYDQFDRERIQPSVDLANRIEMSSCSRVIDIGCGSGMSTLALKRRFPDAAVTGVDLSQSMLEHARKLLEDVEWIRRDCSESLEDLGTFDLVFSNAFLQWLPDQEKFIRDIRKLLNAGGVLAMQIPAFEEMEIAQIIKDTAEKYDDGKTLFADRGNGCFNHSCGEYYEMFSRYYSPIGVWQTNYIHQMESSDAIVDFVRSTALLPYLECLTDKQALEFLNLLRCETAKHYTRSGNGKVLFPFHRMFFIVKI